MTKTLRRLLRPVVRFCLRQSLHVQDIESAVKEVLIEVAIAELESKGQRPNISRLSAATGLHRRDVMRLFREDQDPAAAKPGPEGKGLVSRVIGRWQYDKRFLTPAHRPRTLTIEGGSGEFHELVQSVSNDLNPGTVLRELERIGAVERTARGIKLTSQVYQTKRDAAEGYRMLGEDFGSLADSVEENIRSAHELPNLHARTEFDNIYTDAVPEIREWLLKRGTEFHEMVRDYLSRFDRDFSPRGAGKTQAKEKIIASGVRVVVGTFSVTAVENREKKAAALPSERVSGKVQKRGNR